MVDSSYFKNNKNNGNRAGGKNNGKLKQHKWIPLVVIIVLALAMIAIQYFMLDVLQYTRQMAEQQKEGFINIYPIINNLL